MEPISANLVGRPGMTKQLRQLFQQYNMNQQTQGLQPLDWPMWLEQNGYTLGADKLVMPQGINDIDKLLIRNSY